MPDGTITNDVEKYGAAWRELIDPVADILGMAVIGFDPGCLFGPKPNALGHVSGGTIDLPVGIMVLIKRLHGENKANSEMLASILDTVQQTKKPSYGKIKLENLNAHVQDIIARSKDVFSEWKNIADENDALKKEMDEAKALVAHPPSARPRAEELPEGFDHNNHDYYALASALGMSIATTNRVRGALSSVRGLLNEAVRVVKATCKMDGQPTVEDKNSFVQRADTVLADTAPLDRTA